LKIFKFAADQNKKTLKKNLGGAGGGGRGAPMSGPAPGPGVPGEKSGLISKPGALA
jgi:hypothetical protein